MWTIFKDLITGALSVCAINDPFIKEHSTMDWEQLPFHYSTAEEAQAYINSRT